MVRFTFFSVLALMCMMFISCSENKKSIAELTTEELAALDSTKNAIQNTLLNEGKFEEGLNALQTLQEQYFDDPQIPFIKAFVLDTLGQKEEAQKSFEESRVLFDQSLAKEPNLKNAINRAFCTLLIDGDEAYQKELNGLEENAAYKDSLNMNTIMVLRMMNTATLNEMKKGSFGNMNLRGSDNQLEEEVKARIYDIYQQISEAYADFTSSTLDTSKFFSSTLKKLWNQLPDDDLVVDFDPFIDAQDFDHISVADIEVTNLQEKRADAKVTVDIGFTEPSIIVFKMVKELDENKNPNWMINDFVFNTEKKKQRIFTLTSMILRDIAKNVEKEE